MTMTADQNNFDSAVQDLLKMRKQQNNILNVTIWNIINPLFIAQVYSAWAHNCMYTWDCVIL